MKGKLSEEEVDFIVRNTVADNAFEGLITPPEEVEILKEIVRGNISREKYKKQIIEKLYRE